MPWGGHPQGAPLPIAFSRRYALGRAPTRGAPTDCLLSALCPGEGTHKGCPYRFAMPWGGHPQGAPLPIRHALGRAPTRGAPTDSPCPGEGTHKGRPYRFVMPWGGHPQGVPLPIVFSRRYALGRAPTRGAPTDSPCPGEGTHKGRPYRFVMPWGGHPQGAPLPIRHALGRAPTRGAPTDSLCPGEGAHKGCPYRFAMPWGGRPQGAPLPIRYALGRAPTRGAPTDSPCPGEGTHKGRPYRFAMPWGGHPQGAPLPDSGSLTWVCPNLMQLPCILGCTRLRWAGRGHSSEVEEAVARATAGGRKMEQTFLSLYQKGRRRPTEGTKGDCTRYNKALSAQLSGSLRVLRELLSSCSEQCSLDFHPFKQSLRRWPTTLLRGAFQVFSQIDTGGDDRRANTVFDIVPFCHHLATESSPTSQRKAYLNCSGQR